MMATQKENLQKEKIEKYQERLAQNQRIIMLIRSKLRPLKKIQDNGFPSISEKITPGIQTPNHTQAQTKKKTKPLDLVVNFHQDLELPKHPLLQRAQSFILEKKKNQDFRNTIDEQQQDRMPKISLKKYLDLFEKREEKVDDLSEMRKQLLEYGIEKTSFLTDVNENLDQKQISAEQSSLLNAKIRQRINHRKIIEMYKHR